MLIQAKRNTTSTKLHIPTRVTTKQPLRGLQGAQLPSLHRSHFKHNTTIHNTITKPRQLITKDAISQHNINNIGHTSPHQPNRQAWPRRPSTSSPLTQRQHSSSSNTNNSPSSRNIIKTVRQHYQFRTGTRRRRSTATRSMHNSITQRRYQPHRRHTSS